MNRLMCFGDSSDQDFMVLKGSASSNSNSNLLHINSNF